MSDYADRTDAQLIDAIMTLPGASHPDAKGLMGELARRKMVAILAEAEAICPADPESMTGLQALMALGPRLAYLEMKIELMEAGQRMLLGIVREHAESEADR